MAGQPPQPERLDRERQGIGSHAGNAFAVATVALHDPPVDAAGMRQLERRIDAFGQTLPHRFDRGGKTYRRFSEVAVAE